MFIPYVIEQTIKGERSYDLYSRMLQDYIVFVGEINHETARSIEAQLLFLNAQDDEKPITLYVDSPGGGVYAGLGIIDTMNYITNPVHTIGIGICASFGAVILANGHKGKRGILPSSTVMIHEILGGADGQITNVQIQAKEMVRLKEILTKNLAEKTGQTYERIEKDCNRDFYLSAQEAVEYGLADYIVGKK